MHLQSAICEEELVDRMIKIDLVNHSEKLIIQCTLNSISQNYRYMRQVKQT